MESAPPHFTLLSCGRLASDLTIAKVIEPASDECPRPISFRPACSRNAVLVVATSQWRHGMRESHTVIETWRSEGRAEGVAEGLARGMLEARRADVLRALQVRFAAIPPA